MAQVVLGSMPSEVFSVRSNVLSTRQRQSISVLTALLYQGMGTTLVALRYLQLFVSWACKQSVE